ncbi:MAG: hypothetical protein JXR73_11610 [Candidatus Omnitrophica bacterium]|nr:hypothetical protein [Candidatus Omnitrophota bacterium]
MPGQDHLTTCIRCGRPSRTVVCIHCFLKYESRTIQDEQDKGGGSYPMKRCMPDDEVEFQSEFQKAFQKDEFPSMWEQEEFYTDDDESEESGDSSNDADSSSDSSFSWFSRLPRF